MTGVRPLKEDGRTVRDNESSAFTLTVRDEKGRVQALVPCPDTVSKAVSGAGIGLEMPCGGRGGCGKCRVLFTSGAPVPSDSDRMFLTDREIRAGFRLACTSRLSCDAAVRMPEYKGNFFSAVTGDGAGAGDMTAGSSGAPERGLSEGAHCARVKRCSVALDIGTTTLAASLVPEEGGLPLSGSAVNNGRRYGADVLSRVTAYEGGEAHKLTSLLRTDAERLISDLLDRSGCTCVDRVVISANTAMRHIFSGESLKGLRMSPFDPGDISLKEMIPGEWALKGVPVTLLPGFSAFVGGDILSGIYSLSFVGKGEKAVFIDLGTNAEIAVYNGETLYVTSAAAGPAFEGGQISCGTGSVKGAVCCVQAGPDGDLRIKTIGDEAPVGICGTGLIDIIGILNERRVLEEGFGLPEKYREKGFPVCGTPDGRQLSVTGKDIEALKYAIAAVRAGIEILLKKAGEEDLSSYTAYVAGGFGMGLREESAVASGLLPAGLKGRVRTVGNTSLSGAVKYLKSGNPEELGNLLSRAVHIELAETEGFNRVFLENLTGNGGHFTP